MCVCVCVCVCVVCVCVCARARVCVCESIKQDLKININSFIQPVDLYVFNTLSQCNQN